MRSQTKELEPFREFFLKEEIDFSNLSNNTLVIFDTNTLLNIYRYSESTKNTLITAMEKISNNIWIPYQVGLEFNLNRRIVLEAMKKEKKAFLEDIENNFSKSLLEEAEKKLNSFTIYSKDAKENKREVINKLETKLNEMSVEVFKDVQEWTELINLDLDLVSQIENLFKGKIGNSYNQHELNSKLENAEYRYENNIPPGYKDKDKKVKGVYEKTNYNGLSFEKRFGDLIVWNQIIDKAKSEDFKKIVFVTDDVKEDWWYIVNGKTIGARAELKNELLREANADLTILNSNSFLNHMSNNEPNKKDLLEVVEESIDLDKSINDIFIVNKSNNKIVENEFNLNEIFEDRQYKLFGEEQYSFADYEMDAMANYSSKLKKITKEIISKELILKTINENLESLEVNPKKNSELLIIKKNSFKSFQESIQIQLEKLEREREKIYLQRNNW